MKKDEKTKQLLANTLIELLKRKPLDVITVKELTTASHVSRTAFYNNFKKVEDVLKYVYAQAHFEFFQDKYKDYHYFYSDEYIRDMINFFDKNTDLLKVLFQWQIIGIIAKYNTDIVVNYISKYDLPFLKDNAYYYTCFTGVTYFNVCILWLLKGKDKSKEELFQMIKAFEKIGYHSHE